MPALTAVQIPSLGRAGTRAAFAPDAAVADPADPADAATAPASMRTSPAADAASDRMRERR